MFTFLTFLSPTSLTELSRSVLSNMVLQLASGVGSVQQLKAYYVNQFWKFYLTFSGLPPQDVKLLIEDLGELKPTIFCAVPRVLDRVYSGKMFEMPHAYVYSIPHFIELCSSIFAYLKQLHLYLLTLFHEAITSCDENIKCKNYN